MSADLSLKIDTPAESIEALAKEAEALKTKLEEERQKLNDVARKGFIPPGLVII
jgi:predicted phage tail protein